MTEMVERIGYIARSVDIPVIADADAGYGNAVNVKRAVEELERAGAAAIHIEDEENPKKCALLGDVGHRYRLVSIEEMVGKLKAAQEAREDPNLLIIARVCATGDRDFPDVLARARAYAEAGADAVFLIHLSPDQLAEACRKVPAPIMYNVTHHGGWVQSFAPMDRSFHELEEMGCKFAILSSSVALAGLIGMQKVLEAMRRDGSVFPFFAGEPHAEELSRFYSLSGADEIQEWEARFLPTVKDAEG